jgi:hypothetical protein
LGELLGCCPAAEESHIPAARINKRTHSHHLAAVNELIQECFVPGIDGHDFIAGFSCSGADYNKQHISLPPFLHVISS